MPAFASLLVDDAATLPARWKGAQEYVMLDADFGAGLHFVETLATWRGDAARPRRLFYLALATVLPPAPSAVGELADLWPPAVPGQHRIVLEGGAVILDLLIGAPDLTLPQVTARVDAMFLPAALPEPGQAQLRRLASPPKPPQPVTPASSGQNADQANLADALDAADKANLANLANRSNSTSSKRAIVIGAGLAGAAACERLAARGWAVTLIERHARPAQEASGNLAGIFMPQLSLDDNHATRLGRAAYLFALRHWQQLGGVGLAFDGARCGVLQLARDAAHAAVQRRVAASGVYPPGFARWLESDEAAAMLGAPAPHGGWLFPQGGWAHPAGVCKAMLDACGGRLTRIFCTQALHLERVDGEWQVMGLEADANVTETRSDGASAGSGGRTGEGAGESLNAGIDGSTTEGATSGALLAAAPVLILANGVGAIDFPEAAGLPLQPVRGQVTHLAAAPLAAQGWPQPPLVVCREAYMTPAAQGIVCVGATYDSDADPSVRSSSQDENLAHLHAILGISPEADAPPLAGRTGFRCVAPDRVPLVGALPNPAATPRRTERLRDVVRWPGLYGLLGYASRGLTWAPLAAELLAAQLDGEPLPMETNLATALDPARFLLKQLRRSHD